MILAGNKIQVSIFFLGIRAFFFTQVQQQIDVYIYLCRNFIENLLKKQIKNKILLQIIIRIVIIKVFQESHQVHLQKSIIKSYNNIIDFTLTLMIDIKGTNINSIECYSLTMRKKSFLFISKPNLQNFKHFTASSFEQKQLLKKTVEKSLNPNHDDPSKIQQQHQTILNDHSQNDLSRLKLHLDLNYMKDILKTVQIQPDQAILYIMMTHYQDFIVLPYILRKFRGKREIKISCTHIMYEMGRIYLKQFFNRIFSFDLLNSSPSSLSYQDQSRLEDQFYINFGIEIKTWTKLFTQQQMNQTLTLVNKMNYGQIHDTDGVKFRPFPSGHSLGSCFWILQNSLTKETVMFVKQISAQTWRSFSHNHLIQKQTSHKDFKQKDFRDVDLLIFANSNLITHQKEKEKPESSIQRLLKNILENLQKGINTEIILEDELIILDIIDSINFEMKDKFKAIFIENPQFHQVVSYANSYVEFLSLNYKQRIYQDPPQYPFDAYLILKQKGFIYTGTLYDICEKQKIPLKELMRRSTPYIHFKPNYEAYLSCVEDTPPVICYKQQDHFTPQDLNSLLANVNPKKIISYTNILPFIQQKYAQNTGILNYGKKFEITSQALYHYTSKNISPNIINKYEFIDGFIMAYPVNRQFLRLNSSWKEEVHKHLRQRYRQVLEIKENKIRTRYTELTIENYQISIKSSDLKDLQNILQIISAITKTLRLK